MASNNDNNQYNPNQAFVPLWHFIQSLQGPGQPPFQGHGVDNIHSGQWPFGPADFGTWGPPPRGGPWHHGQHGHWSGPWHGNREQNNSGNDQHDGEERAQNDEHDNSPGTVRTGGNEGDEPQSPLPSQGPSPPFAPPRPFAPHPHHGPASPGHGFGGRRGGRGGHGACRGGRGRGGPHRHGPCPFPHPPPPPPQHGGPGFGEFRIPPWMRGLQNNPFLQGLAEQLRQYASQYGAAREDGQQEEDSFNPPIDIFNRPGEWQVHVALPGAKKEDVGVNWDIDKCSLNVAGVVYHPGDEEFIQSLTHGERKVGMFDRTIRIPPEGSDEKDEANGDAISAKLEDGVLIVIIPKIEKEWTEIRKVDIE